MYEPSAPPASRTVLDELDRATAALDHAGLPHGQLNALNTWSALAGVDPATVWSRRLDRAPAGDFVSRFHDAIARQSLGEPFQYAVGLVAFRNLTLAVDRRVIIPRGGSAGIVDEVLKFGRWGVAADVGTGCGALALSLATEGKFSKIVATDVSAEALAVARQNVDAVAPPIPVELRQGSWLQPLSGMVLDVIVANPPYVQSKDWAKMMPWVRNFEPRLAFDGGPDGLDGARALLGGAAALLAPGGLLVFEMSPDRGDETLSLGHACGWKNARLEGGVSGRGLYFIASREQ